MVVPGQSRIWCRPNLKRLFPGLYNGPKIHHNSKHKKRCTVCPFHKISNDDLSDYVDSGEGQGMGHFYVYNLMGEGQFGPVSRATVAKAIDHLEKFSIVGCLEHLDIFMKQFEELFHKKLVIKAQNRNPLDKSKQKEQISEEIFKKVEKICQPDMQIYNLALSRLERSVPS